MVVTPKLSNDGKSIICTANRRLNSSEELNVYLSVEDSNENNMGLVHTNDVYHNFSDVIIESSPTSFTISVEKLTLLFQSQNNRKYSIQDFIGKQLQISVIVKYGYNNQSYYSACDQTIVLPGNVVSSNKEYLIGEWKAKCYIRDGKEYPYAGLGIPKDWGITINDNLTYTDNTTHKTGKVDFLEENMTLVSDYKGVKDLKILEVNENEMSLDYNIGNVTLVLEKVK